MHQPKACLQDALTPPGPEGHFVMIPLTQGKFTIVDEADAGLVLSAGCWYAIRAPRTWYAVRSASGVRLHMHTLIADVKGPDHVNRNGLDNRRINLRTANQSQNCANQGVPSNNTSGYKGVTRNRANRKWKAQINVNGQYIYLGTFDDSAEAARAYNEAALEHFGEFAWLNPLPDVTEPPAA